MITHRLDDWRFIRIPRNERWPRVTARLQKTDSIHAETAFLLFLTMTLVAPVRENRAHLHLEELCTLPRFRGMRCIHCIGCSAYYRHQSEK